MRFDVIIIIWAAVLLSGCSSAMKLPPQALLGKAPTGGEIGWKFEPVMEITPPRTAETDSYFGATSLSNDGRELTVEVEHISWPEPEREAVRRYERRRYAVPSGTLIDTSPIQKYTRDAVDSRRPSTQPRNASAGPMELLDGADVRLRNTATSEQFDIFSRFDYRPPSHTYFFSPSGKYLIGAFRSGPYFLGGDLTEGHIRVWDTTTGELLVWWRYPESAYRVSEPIAYFRQGSVLAYGGHGPLTIFDLQSRTQVATLDVRGDVIPTDDESVFLEAHPMRIRIYGLSGPGLEK